MRSLDSEGGQSLNVWVCVCVRAYVSVCIRVCIWGFHMDRTETEHEGTMQAALGIRVWRYKDGRDAFWQDNLGPSKYSKGQGKPVKVWGVLAHGHLSIHILEEGENMNQDVYSDLIEEHFDTWLLGCDKLVCDFESCLRTAKSIQELRRIKVDLVEGYPRCSQDFNAIENAWDLVKQRLDETLPRKLESRDDFIARYREAVRWVNRNRNTDLWYLCTNQKERARDCLKTKPRGGRTKW